MRYASVSYEKAKRAFNDQSENHIFFIGDVFKDVEEPIFIDPTHIGPRGNEIVAQEIFNRLNKNLNEN